MRWSYRCPSCGATYDIEPGRYLCDRCSSRNAPGRPLGGVLECVFEGKPERGAIPMPVESTYFPPLPVGDTPLWAPIRLRAKLGSEGLWLKDDTCEPSGSYKDRASFLVAAFARKHGIEEVALASTGNAASSMACVGAASGLKVTVFLPKTAPVAKRVQVLQYGAELREIDGSYDVAFDACLEYTSGGAARGASVLSRNTAYNPLTIEGKKTAAFEIVRALRLASSRALGGASRRLALHVFVPTGDGVILAGLYRGFEDLLALGEIERMPTLWAAQAEGSCAISRALDAGGFDADFEYRSSSTIADSIAVDAPRNGVFALEKMRKHGGVAVVVTDDEILEAQRLSSSQAGLFAEPSSACALAGFIKVRASLGKDETAVVMLTGSGLKDIKSAALAVGADMAY